MKSKLAALLIAALATIGLVAISAGPSEAHTGKVSSDCDGLSVALSNYQKGEAQTGPWWVWAPNHSQGPQDYEPAFPTDARGTWIGPKVHGGPERTTEGTFNVSHGGNSSWFHRGPEVPAGVNHVTVTIDNMIVTDEDFETSFSKDYAWANDEGHDYTVTVTAWDNDKYSFTQNGHQDACVVKDASASVTTTPATCEHGETLVYGDFVNATADEGATPDGTEGPESYNVPVSADQGHEFSDGSTSQNFSGDLAGPDQSKCTPPPPATPRDATANVALMGPTCTVPGSAEVTDLVHATLVGTLDESVGDHVAPFQADEGHAFSDGSTKLEVPYTILGKKSCGPPPPPHHHNPPHHNTPPPTVVDAGL